MKLETGGLEYVVFFHVLGIIIPIDFHIFSEGLKPPTRYVNVQKYRKMSKIVEKSAKTMGQLWEK